MRMKSILVAGLPALCVALLLAPAPGALAKSRRPPVGKGVIYRAPVLSVSDAGFGPRWERGFEDVYDTLLSNLHGPNRFFDTRFAYPSPVFRGVYLWDTAFISQVWKPWDTATASEINRAVLEHADGGRLQHFVGPYGESDYTQPPVMAWSVWENYQWSGDKDELRRAYPILVDYNRWLYSERRLDNGLFFWVHSYESGIDNSPRFTSADEFEKKDLTRLAAVDLNSYMVRQNEALADMARALGRQDDAERFQKMADEQRALANEHLWDEDTGLYYDRDMDAGSLLKIKSNASLFPLFAGIPDKERARRVRDHVMDPEEFNTPMPLPSVARDDPAFQKDCWRGPIWINSAYMIVAGMERNGFREEAATLSFKLADGVFKTYENTGKIVEFYDPDRFDFKELNRKKGNLYKQITLSNKPQPNFVGWTGLANTLVIQHLAGYKKEAGKARLEPWFPREAAGAKLVLKLPAENAAVELTVRDDGGARGTVTKDGRSIEFDLAPGESLPLD